MNNKGYTLSEVMGLMVILLIIGLFIGSFYVVGHFIVKYW